MGTIAVTNQENVNVDEKDWHVRQKMLEVMWRCGSSQRLYRSRSAWRCVTATLHVPAARLGRAADQRTSCILTVGQGSDDWMLVGVQTLSTQYKSLLLGQQNKRLTFPFRTLWLLTLKLLSKCTSLGSFAIIRTFLLYLYLHTVCSKRAINYCVGNCNPATLVYRWQRPARPDDLSWWLVLVRSGRTTVLTDRQQRSILQLSSWRHLLTAFTCVF